jgi:CheY-like chemotaxis protein
MTGAEPGAYRVLVAEDHPVHQRLIRATLEAFGCDVTVVEDGFDAVAAASVTPFALIILDRHMRYSGGDVASLIIKSGGASRTAMIACYSTDKPSHSEATLYDAVLLKPATPEAFLALIRAEQAGHAVSLVSRQGRLESLRRAKTLELLVAHGRSGAPQ